MKRKFSRALALLLTLVLCLSITAAATEPTTDELANEITQQEDLYEKFLMLLETYSEYSLEDYSNEELLKNLVKSLLENHPELFVEMVNGMVHTTDPYTYYFTEDEYKVAFYPPDYVGIGVTVELQGEYIVVIDVTNNSPAQRAGLQVGDKLISADGETMVGISVTEGAVLIRGEEGSTVTLVVERGGQQLSYDITREAIRTESITSQMLDNNIAYVRIRDFEDFGVFIDFYNTMMKFYNDGVAGYIIDVRNNTGGDVATALNMVNVIVGNQKGILATFHDYDGSNYSIDTVDTGMKFDNVAVLINEYSFSSAEVFAGIVKDFGAGTLIGKKTGGKGRGQSHLQMDDGSVLTVTSSEITLPKSGKYHKIGIKPDMEVEGGIQVFTQDKPDFVPMNSTKALKLNDVDGNVLALKQRLSYLGYTITTFDYVYSNNLASAVSAFQKDYNLPQTGKADIITMQRVEEAVAARISGSASDVGYADRQLWAAYQLVMKGK